MLFNITRPDSSHPQDAGRPNNRTNMSTITLQYAWHMQLEPTMGDRYRCGVVSQLPLVMYLSCGVSLRRN